MNRAKNKLKVIKVGDLVMVKKPDGTEKPYLITNVDEFFFVANGVSFFRYTGEENTRSIPVNQRLKATVK